MEQIIYIAVIWLWSDAYSLKDNVSFYHVPFHRKGQDCGNQSRPSTQSHVVVLPVAEAK